MTNKSVVFDVLKKTPSLLLAFSILAFAILLNLKADLGVGPWGVLHVGIAEQTVLTLGQATIVVGFAVLLFSMFLGVVPGFATVLNMFMIGIMIDVIESLGVITTPESLMGRYLMLFAGIALMGWAILLYLQVHLGAGPRDGLMEGLVLRFKKPAWLVRGLIEFVALAAGCFLGGPVGIGTIIFAATIGFSVDVAFKLGKYDSKNTKHVDCVELYHRVKST
ncbi:MAG: membrane protein [Clostridiales bacterium]|nr:membrane protein [Clostridiales bacterium]